MFRGYIDSFYIAHWYQLSAYLQYYRTHWFGSAIFMPIEICYCAKQAANKAKEWGCSTMQKHAKAPLASQMVPTAHKIKQMLRIQVHFSFNLLVPSDQKLAKPIVLLDGAEYTLGLYGTIHAKQNPIWRHDALLRFLTLV